MALTNFVKPTTDTSTATPIEYVNMCIGSSRTCAELLRNFCITSIHTTPYAGTTTTGGVCVVGNNSTQYSHSLNMVIPKGNCLSGTCVTTFHGYFFGD